MITLIDFEAVLGLTRPVQPSPNRPEQALSKARDLIADDKTQAYVMLHTYLTTLTYHTAGLGQSWSQLEECLDLFLDLAINERAAPLPEGVVYHFDFYPGLAIRDVLTQYRNILQNNQPAMVERAMEKAIDMAEAHLDHVIETASSSASPFDIAYSTDFDADYTPDELIRTVYMVDDQEYKAGIKARRTPIREAARLIWDMLRNFLDLTRHNSRLEAGYLAIGTRAVQFCVNRVRPEELRKLAEVLHTHYGIIHRFPSQANSIDLTLDTSNRRQQSVRQALLSALLEAKQWTLAFHTLEDLYHIQQSSPCPSHPQDQLFFYQVLAMVLGANDANALFLAACWHRLVQLIRTSHDSGSENTCDESLNPGITEPLLNTLPTLVQCAQKCILATLAVPAIRSFDRTCHLSPEERHSKNMRMAHMIGLRRQPTRHGLLSELKELIGIVSVGQQQSTPATNDAINPYKELFDMLHHGPKTGDMDQLSSWRMHFKNQLNKVSSTNAERSPLLETSFVCQGIWKNALIRAVQSVASRQDQCKISDLAKAMDVEPRLIIDIILQACLVNDFQAKIEQSRDLVTFDRSRFLLDAADLAATTAQVKERAPLRLDGWNYLLSQIDAAYQVICKEQGVTPIDMEQPIHKLCDSFARRQDLNDALIETWDVRQNMIKAIAVRREQQKAALAAKEREEARERALRLQAEQEALQKRHSEEAAKRERERLQTERETIRRIEAKKMETERTRLRAIAQAKQDMDKLLTLVKRADYLERAAREVEQPLLKDEAVKQRDQDRIAWEIRNNLRRERALEAHRMDMQTRARLPAMLQDKEIFSNKLMGQRQIAHAEQVTKVQEALQIAREKLKLELERERESKEKEAELENNVEELNNGSESTVSVQQQTSEQSKTYVPAHRRKDQQQPANLSTPQAQPIKTGAPPSGPGSWRRQS